jgi:hypothetical protein
MQQISFVIEVISLRLRSKPDANASADRFERWTLDSSKSRTLKTTRTLLIYGGTVTVFVHALDFSYDNQQLGQHLGDLESFDCSYSQLYPRQYVAYKLGPESGLSPTTLDGDLTKSVWEEVPWTENFVDISTTTTPKFGTAAKVEFWCMLHFLTNSQRSVLLDSLGQ